MTFWLFTKEMLGNALTAHEAERQAEGATEQQAKDETMVILAFISGNAARSHKMCCDDGRG